MRRLTPTAQAACQNDLEEARLRYDKLEVSIKALSNRLEAARKWIGLDERHLRDSLDCSLEIMGMKGLESAGKTGSISRFTFPDLSRRRGADPSWAVTLAALKPRATNGDRPAGEAPLELLPVVFEAPETQDDNVIQLHLEHKLVKRLLGRFLSQGFLHHDLSRACLVQSEDSIPRVALLGRLSVIREGCRSPP